MTTIRPLIVAVTGGSGSGKTTAVQGIRELVGDSTTLIAQDSYYRDLSHLPFEERKLSNFDHPDAIDLELLGTHLAELALGQSIAQPIYDFKLHTRADNWIKIEPQPVILVDGILLLVDARLRSLFDLTIFVDVPDDVRLSRRLERDMAERGRSREDIVRQYITTVRPMYQEFVAPCMPWADIVLTGGGRNRDGVEQIAERIHLELSKRTHGG